MATERPGGSPESSVDLLVRARAGDERALERLCQRLRPELRRWAHGRLPIRAREIIDTDDLVQDTLLRTVQRIGTFEPRHDGALRAFLRQALLNRMRDELRRRRRRPEREDLDSQTPHESASPLEQAVGAQNVERYEAALARVSPEERELIVMRIELGLGYEEMAAASGKPTPNAARMAVARAIARLGQEIAREP